MKNLGIIGIKSDRKVHDIETDRGPSAQCECCNMQNPCAF